MSLAIAGVVLESSARADGPAPEDTPPATARPPAAKPPTKSPPPSAGPPAPAQPPSAAPPTASPPSAAPPTAAPPTAAPPTAAPPSGAPPSAAPPSAAPPTVAAPTETPPTDAPPAESEPAEVTPTEPSAPESEPAEADAAAEDEVPRVADAAWEAMLDKDVTVETREGTKVAGKLLSHDDENAVLAQPDGKVVTVAKADAVGLEFGIEAPAPAPKPPAKKSPPPQKFHHFGVFTSHGVTYSHFRKADVGFARAGAAYALDAAVGYNFNPRFGLYAILGGNVGARLQGDEWRGNTGKLAMGFLMKRKYVAFIPGIGVAFSDVRGPERFRGAGLAIPLKLMGVIPLKKPEGLFIGIGVMWDFGYVRGGLMSNAIGGQVTVGRW